MSMSVGSADDGEESVMSEINTTPLVDIMLVLLIIFLITSPVVLKTIKVNLPAEVNEPVKTTPEDINISVDKDGNTYINQRQMANSAELLEELKKEAVKVPQPAVHIRGDSESAYQAVGKVILTSQRAGIQKVGFIISPPDKM
jgi:biopolymer transport protein ExbD